MFASSLRRELTSKRKSDPMENRYIHLCMYIYINILLFKKRRRKLENTDTHIHTQEIERESEKVEKEGKNIKQKWSPKTGVLKADPAVARRYHHGIISSMADHYFFSPCFTFRSWTLPQVTRSRSRMSVRTKEERLRGLVWRGKLGKERGRGETEGSSL